MDRLLQPDIFNADPTTPSASKEWTHWKSRFQKFITKVQNVTDEDKLSLLVNLVSTDVYTYIRDSATYNQAIAALEAVYNPKKNIIFARHLLSTCRQEAEQSIDSYYQKLRSLAKDCEFTEVTKDVHECEAIREAFISGLQSVEIRQRLLESDKNELSEIHSLARSLEVARVQAQSYSHGMSLNAIPESQVNDCDHDKEHDDIAAATSGSRWSCWFCGGHSRHSKREECPAFNVKCNSCGIKGHFQKVCNNTSKSRGQGQSRNQQRRNSQPRHSQSQDMTSSALNHITLAAAPPGLSRSIRKVIVNGKELEALIDSGSSVSFISLTSIRKHGWKLHHEECGPVSMASSSHVSHPSGFCTVDIHFLGEKLINQKVMVMKDLCAEMIVGLDILGGYQSVTLELGGEKPPAVISAACGIEPPSLFGEPDPSWRPISVKSRRYSEADKRFIKQEIAKLEQQGVIKECKGPCPWRAQVLVHHGNDTQKKRLVIDYSQTINRYTKLDAYPVPRIDEMVEEISKYQYYTTLDLSSAYHQIPIRVEEQQYTAFEANGKLYICTAIPFGVMNGVSAFQRVMDKIVADEKLPSVYVYVDNITIGGRTKLEHDQNLKTFLSAASRYNLQFNDSKTVTGVTSVKLLGYLVSHNSIKPDPDRIKPLLDIPAPHDDKSLRSILGLFAHYSRWVKNFSEKIHPLSHATTFPINEKEYQSFCLLKSEIAKSVLATPDLTKPFIVETDASDYAIGATLSQSHRPVAFFSRTLNKSERNHHSVEKEAYAIVESIRKWKHYLLGSTFTVKTDQRSVSFMFSNANHGKIKNDKIARWRIELSPYGFDIEHRPGKDNLPADALSRS